MFLRRAAGPQKFQKSQQPVLLNKKLLNKKQGFIPRMLVSNSHRFPLCVLIVSFSCLRFCWFTSRIPWPNIRNSRPCLQNDKENVGLAPSGFQNVKKNAGLAFAWDGWMDSRSLGMHAHGFASHARPHHHPHAPPHSYPLLQGLYI